MTTKLEDSNTAPKTYWVTVNRFLYNKKIPAVPPLLVYGSLFFSKTFSLLYADL